ncbi:hypothetical protein J2755_002108 [Methanohalophilus levihalophilus]|uniref:DUF2209 domain-containing protein n=1 Tax=Methanohalophilus levihalophilus TaxID=1431282 RepID=UPI001AE7EED5|nr:DUF2209 domain-containing protein [Methanohalophilus levihalophilus]MBP2031160.1 hypothetical protein [Methanohalophilus levihalophilus]
MLDTIIAVDISGRHYEDNRYFMVSAAVALSYSEGNIRGIEGIHIIPFSSVKPPEVTDVVHMVEETVEGTGINGTVVAERGDMFNQPEDLVKQMFRVDFKYPESMAEKLGIEFAHHVSLSSRNLLLKQEVHEI